MIIFHTLVLLMSSQDQIDKSCFNLYEKEFNSIIQADFDVKRYQEQVRREVEDPNSNDLQIDKNIYTNPEKPEVSRVRSKLPPFFCLDIFFKYRMYDQACSFLYYRYEFDELLLMIKFEYDESKLLCEQLKSKIEKMKKKEGEADTAEATMSLNTIQVQSLEQ